MSDDRERQLEALIQASVDTALEKANAAFEQRITGLVKKNEELLSEKKRLQGKSEAERMIALADRQMANPAAGIDDFSSRIVFDPTKHSSADYQRMKADAEKRGIEFQVLSRTPASNAALTPSNVAQFDHQNAGVRYVRRDVVDRYGLVNLNEQAKRDGLRVQSYRSRNELPEDAISAHDAAAKGGDT